VCHLLAQSGILQWRLPIYVLGMDVSTMLNQQSQHLRTQHHSPQAHLPVKPSHEACAQMLRHFTGRACHQSSGWVPIALMPSKAATSLIAQHTPAWTRGRLPSAAASPPRHLAGPRHTPQRAPPRLRQRRPLPRLRAALMGLPAGDSTLALVMMAGSAVQAGFVPKCCVTSCAVAGTASTALQRQCPGTSA
jgi:hypothetical protein